MFSNPAQPPSFWGLGENQGTLVEISSQTTVEIMLLRFRILILICIILWYALNNIRVSWHLRDLKFLLLNFDFENVLQKSRVIKARHF